MNSDRRARTVGAARSARAARPVPRALQRSTIPDDEATWDAAHEYAQRVPAKYLECRVRQRHAWRPSAATPLSWGFEISERCTNCGSRVEYSIDRRGIVVVPRKITYSDGYRNTAGDGRITGDALGAVRLEWITRKLSSFGKGAAE